MRKQFTYSGRIAEEERYANNLAVYEEELARAEEKHFSSEKIIEIAQRVKFQRWVDHSKTYTRTISHLVDAYWITNPTFHSSGRYTSTPEGKLVHAAQIDFRKILSNMNEGTFGLASSSLGDPNEFGAEHYLETEFEERNKSYQFSLPKLSQKGPFLKFKIVQKVTIDDFVFPDKIEYAYPVFIEKGAIWGGKKILQKWNILSNPTSDFTLADVLRD